MSQEISRLLSVEKNIVNASLNGDYTSLIENLHVFQHIIFGYKE